VLLSESVVDSFKVFVRWSNNNSALRHLRYIFKSIIGTFRFPQQLYTIQSVCHDIKLSFININGSRKKMRSQFKSEKQKRCHHPSANLCLSPDVINYRILILHELFFIQPTCCGIDKSIRLWAIMRPQPRKAHVSAVCSIY